MYIYIYIFVYINTNNELITTYMYTHRDIPIPRYTHTCIPTEHYRDTETQGIEARHWIFRFQLSPDSILNKLQLVVCSKLKQYINTYTYINIYICDIYYKQLGRNYSRLNLLNSGTFIVYVFVLKSSK